MINRESQIYKCIDDEDDKLLEQIWGLREVGKNWPWGSRKEGGGQGEVGAVRRKVGLQHPSEIVAPLLLAVLKTFDP